MLTAELVLARRHKGELKLQKIDELARGGMLDLAEALLALASDHVGRTRDELEAAWDAVDVEGMNPKLAAGVRKMVEDGCEFDREPDVPPADLRREVFLRAAAERKARGEGDHLERDAVLGPIAEARGVDIQALDRMLYADLKGANVLRASPSSAGVTPASLVAGYDLAQAQAVLLRAVRVTCDVRCASAGASRAFFRKLKFLRLLFTVVPLSDDRFRVEIDGPFSLFDAVTKYGLKLAMLLPALAEVDAYALEAELRWGKEREKLVFRTAGEVLSVDAARPEKAHLPDDVAALLEALKGQKTPWKAKVASQVLDLPGVGLSVPDLVLTHEQSRATVYVEVMGYWSRDAVWKRVELVERGLRHKVLFAVSSRLRVSEQVLPDESPSALYVYKGTMSAKAVLEKATALATRG